MNYKIRITAENQAIIKRIADENGMNPTNLNFCSFPQYYYMKGGIFPFLTIEDDFLSYPELTFEQFKAMFDKQESLVGRYFKALEHNAQSSEIIKDEFYKIEYETEYSIYFKVPTQTHNLRYSLSKENENEYYELMPIGFDPSKPATPKIIHYIDAVDDIEVWNWFCENFDSKEDKNDIRNFRKVCKYYGCFEFGITPKFVFDNVKDKEEQLNAKLVKLTLKEFKEKYMKTETKETELDKWLKETKAKNLSFNDLWEYVDHANYDIITQKLKGNNPKEKAEILFSQWNPQGAPFEEESKEIETKPHGFCENKNSNCTDNYCNENGCVERKRILVEPTEWQPKRGDKVLVWNDSENEEQEAIFFGKDKKSILVFDDKAEYNDYSKDITDASRFILNQFKHMKPLPTEPIQEIDYKSKVIELIENKKTAAIESMEKASAAKNHDDAWGFQSESFILEDLLNKIKEL